MLEQISSLLEKIGAEWSSVLLTLLLALAAGLAGGFRWCATIVQTYRAQRRARHTPPIGDFKQYDIHKETRYWVEPRVSSLNPSARHFGKPALGSEEKLLAYLRRATSRTDAPPYLFLLSESGMGKTAALANFAYSERRRDPRRRIALFSCRSAGVVERIGAVENPKDCDLLVDAVDEDGTARKDPVAFIEAIFAAAEPFRSVILTCRSQFFRAEAEIPERVGVFRFGRGLADSDQWLLERVYLCPFADSEVERLVRRKYAPWQRRRRRVARSAIARLGELKARPLVLSYLDDILEGHERFATLYQVYDEIVAKWIAREKPWVKDSVALATFSRKLAVDLYVHSATRGGERATVKEIESLAATWSISLETWDMHSRSLLTRDSDYHYRFAHRSLLEFLFVKSYLLLEPECLDVRWTELMLAFLQDARDAGGIPSVISQKILEAYLGTESRGVALEQVAPIVLGKMTGNEILVMVLALLRKSTLSHQDSAYMECNGDRSRDVSSRTYGAPLANVPEFLLTGIRSRANEVSLLEWMAFTDISVLEAMPTTPYRGWLVGWTDSGSLSAFRIANESLPSRVVIEPYKPGWETELLRMAQKLRFDDTELRS